VVFDQAGLQLLGTAARRTAICSVGTVPIPAFPSGDSSGGAGGEGKPAAAEEIRICFKLISKAGTLSVC